MNSRISTLFFVLDKKQALFCQVLRYTTFIFDFIVTEGEETITMTMTSLVQSLIDEEHPLTAESINAIEVFDVVEDLKG